MPPKMPPLHLSCNFSMLDRLIDHFIRVSNRKAIILPNQNKVNFFTIELKHFKHNQYIR